MSRYPWAVALMLVGLAPAAWAEVFRCVKDGTTVFSDKPCAADAQAYTPKEPLTVVPAGGPAPDLAKQFDRSVEAGKAARDKADAAWNKDYQARKATEGRVAKARIEGRATVGMSAADVRNLLGEPYFTSHNENRGVVREGWTYRNRDGSRTVVRFKDGVVTEVTTTRGRRK
ncbi:MAG: DUF4124 domain-containing protein [Nevskiaceae bacterium]|nr:MAG: DUF4124 domain-containing protein [Nevskiaceae bacterium]